ncbi:MAG: HNH endonuclease [Gemmatimonadota bacterium]
MRRHYYRNREQESDRYRRWREENPEKARAKVRRRRALRANAEGECTPEQLQARIEYYGGRCYVCSGPYEEIDHVIPLSEGGSEWPANLRPICRHCNASKGARPLTAIAA